MRRLRPTRALAMVVSAGLIVACAEESDAPPRGTEPDGSAVAAADGRDDRGLDLFVDQPTEDAQLLFVGEDSTILPDDRRAIFLPFSTFSVEREGIPNEFPPVDSLARLLEDAGVGGNRVVIVGEPIPAGRAFAAFEYLGLGDRASLLDGGPAAVAEPEDARQAPRADSELGIDVRDDMIVDADWVHDRLDDPSVAIIDARPPEEFSGETPGEGIDRPGHIPGARNVFWQTLVQSPDDPRLLDEEELRRIFERAGVGPDDTIVAYCRTGGQSSFLYAVARHLGYDVRLYDGSFVDWSRTEYPVER